MRVDDNTRESLRRDIRFDDGGRLEQVLMNWIESRCSSVTWEKILDVLSSMTLKKTARDVKEYLKDQQVIDKYKSKPDYTPD